MNRIVRHLAPLLVLLAGLAPAIHGQDWDNAQALQRAGLSEQEIAQVTRVFDETEEAMRQARLEVDVLKAQLRRLLFDENVDMREVERLLRQSLEWELKERLAQIRRQVELRRILGDRRYARLAREVRERLRQEGGPDEEAAERAPKSKP